jgi:hypothetical protein
MALTNADATRNGFSSAVRDAWLSANHMPLFTQHSPILKMFQQMGRIKPAGYGVVMREPLMVPVTTGPQLEGVTNAYADRAPQPMTGYTTAEYPLSEYIIDVSWQDYDDKRAGGDVEMVRWQEAHFINAEKRSFNKILADFWAIEESPKSAGARDQIASIRTFINGGQTTGTTLTSDGGAQPPALSEQSELAFVSASSASAITLVGGIERNAAGAAYWCPPIHLGGANGSVAFSMLYLNDLYQLAYQGDEHPNLIIMPPALFSKLQNLMTVAGANGGQIYTGSKLGEAGFDAIRWRGCEIVTDRRCPTAGFNSGSSTAKLNNVFCLNMNHLTMRMDGKKPKFKDVPTNKPIQEHVGQWFMALTADHLGNVHSRGINYTQ